MQSCTCQSESSPDKNTTMDVFAGTRATQGLPRIRDLFSPELFAPEGSCLVLRPSAKMPLAGKAQGKLFFSGSPGSMANHKEIDPTRPTMRTWLQGLQARNTRLDSERLMGIRRGFVLEAPDMPPASWSPYDREYTKQASRYGPVLDRDDRRRYENTFLDTQIGRKVPSNDAVFCSAKKESPLHYVQHPPPLPACLDIPHSPECDPDDKEHKEPAAKLVHPPHQNISVTHPSPHDDTEVAADSNGNRSPSQTTDAQIKIGRVRLGKDGNNAGRFECGWCNKRFSRPSSLRTHINSHTGEKPYCCDVPWCGRRFSVHSNLRRHQKNHSVSDFSDHA